LVRLRTHLHFVHCRVLHHVRLRLVALRTLRFSFVWFARARTVGLFAVCLPHAHVLGFRSAFLRTRFTLLCRSSVTFVAFTVRCLRIVLVWFIRLRLVRGSRFATVRMRTWFVPLYTVYTVHIAVTTPRYTHVLVSSFPGSRSCRWIGWFGSPTHARFVAAAFLWLRFALPGCTRLRFCGWDISSHTWLRFYAFCTLHTHHCTLHTTPRTLPTTHTHTHAPHFPRTHTHHTRTHPFGLVVRGCCAVTRFTVWFMHSLVHSPVYTHLLFCHTVLRIPRSSFILRCLYLHYGSVLIFGLRLLPLCVLCLAFLHGLSFIACWFAFHCTARFCTAPLRSRSGCYAHAHSLRFTWIYVRLHTSRLGSFRWLRSFCVYRTVAYVRSSRFRFRSLRTHMRFHAHFVYHFHAHTRTHYSTTPRFGCILKFSHAHTHVSFFTFHLRLHCLSFGCHTFSTRILRSRYIHYGPFCSYFTPGLHSSFDFRTCVRYFFFFCLFTVWLPRLRFVAVRLYGLGSFAVWLPFRAFVYAYVTSVTVHFAHNSTAFRSCGLVHALTVCGLPGLRFWFTLPFASVLWVLVQFIRTCTRTLHTHTPFHLPPHAHVYAPLRTFHASFGCLGSSPFTVACLLPRSSLVA